MVSTENGHELVSRGAKKMVFAAFPNFPCLKGHFMERFDGFEINGIRTGKHQQKNEYYKHTITIEAIFPQRYHNAPALSAQTAYDISLNVHNFSSVLIKRDFGRRIEDVFIASSVRLRVVSPLFNTFSVEQNHIPSFAIKNNVVEMIVFFVSENSNAKFYSYA